MPDSKTLRAMPLNLAGNVWGGLAAMLVALPAAIAFGVTIFSPLGAARAAEGALAGLIGAAVLGVIASLCGGRSRLITAPSAPAAAVLSALALTLSQQGTETAIVLVQLGLVGLLAGAIQVGFGAVGIGQLIRFIPFPVVSGYLSGVGLIIIGGQFPKFVGAPSGTGFLQAWGAPWSWQSLVVGSTVVVTMLSAPRLTRAVPAVIVALIVGIATYFALGLVDRSLLTTVGNPLVIGELSRGDAGFPEMIRRHWLAMQTLDLHDLAQIVAPALALAALLSVDTLKTCLAADALTNSHHDANRELIGQGLGNISSALIGGVPGSGTMGATLINISSGARTWHSSLIAGGFSLLAFVLFAPLIAWVPIAALAGILMVVAYRMIDRQSLSFFFTPTTRLDFLVIVSVIVVAIFGNLVAASGVGVALAILLFIREQARSSVVRNRIEGGELRSRQTRLYGETALAAQERGDLVVFELQGSLFFGTASQLQAALEPEIGARKYVVLSMRRVQSLDVTATHVLERIKDRLEEHKAYLIFCDIPKGLPSGLKMKRFLKETGVVRPTNRAFAFRELDQALEWIAARDLDGRPDEAAADDPVDLRQMPIFAGCSAAAIDALAAVAQRRTVKAGKRLYKAGDDGGALYFIRQGAVRLTVPMRKKSVYHLATCGPGDLIGDTSFIETRKFAADAVALVDTEVYSLTQPQFETLASAHGDLALAVMARMASNLATRLQATISEVQILRG